MPGTDRATILQILQFLREQRSYDFSGSVAPMIERRIRKRMLKAQVESLEAYSAYVRENQAEIDLLINEITVNVSRFFRDTMYFDYLEQEILPEVIESRVLSGNRSIRAWSAGCSAGEETYSIAIAILNALKKTDTAFSVKVFGTDINKDVLLAAEEGLYNEDAVADVKYGILQRFFTRENGKFRVVREVKEVVSFYHYNLLDERNYVPPETIYGNFDLVFCRNVLIYYESEIQRTIFEKITKAPGEGMYLFLGDAESLKAGQKNEYRQLCPNLKIYQRANKQ